MKQYQTSVGKFSVVFFFSLLCGNLAAQSLSPVPRLLPNWLPSVNAAVERIEQRAGDWNDSDETDDPIFHYAIDYLYNENGDLVKLLYYNPEGEVVRETTFHYRQRLLTAKNDHFISLNRSNNESYRYDNNGRLQRLDHEVGSGRFGWWFIYNYDTAGKIISETKYDIFWYGVVVFRRRFNYDAAGILIGSDEYGMDDLFIRSNHFRYDQQNRLIGSESRGGDNDLLMDYSCSYDQSGAVAAETWRTENGIKIEKRYSYRYDQHNNITQWQVITELFNGRTTSGSRINYQNNISYRNE